MAIRLILIGILLFSSFGLVSKGLITLRYISAVPGTVYIVVLQLIINSESNLAISQSFKPDIYPVGIE